MLGSPKRKKNRFCSPKNPHLNDTIRKYKASRERKKSKEILSTDK